MVDIEPVDAVELHDVDEMAATDVGRDDDATAEDQMLLGHLHLVAVKLAKQFGLTEGYRLVVIANDVDLVQGGLAQSVAKFRAPAEPPVALAAKANGVGAKLIETDRKSATAATLAKIETNAPAK
jgi:hypothetical protein